MKRHEGALARKRHVGLFQEFALIVQAADGLHGLVVLDHGELKDLAGKVVCRGLGGHFDFDHFILGLARLGKGHVSGIRLLLSNRAVIEKPPALPVPADHAGLGHGFPARLAQNVQFDLVGDPQA